MKEALKKRIEAFDHELEVGRLRLAGLAQEMENVKAVMQRIQGARAFAGELLSQLPVEEVAPAGEPD